jgi:ArsR family transcriptional regulator, lead/cadmium/zinc/bismuth-responsive transcriptional repressor
MIADRCDVFHLDPARVAALKRRLLNDGSAAALAETFKLLGDPTRVRMLDALSRSELCVCDLAGLLRLSESAVSHQLRLLRGMRLVRPRRAGRMVFYALDDQHIVGLFEQGLEHVEERRSRLAHRPASTNARATADAAMDSTPKVGADLRVQPKTKVRA